MPDPLLTLAGLGAAAAAWGFAIEPRLLRLRRVAIRSPAWPAGWPALRIGVLSDLHASHPHVTQPRIARLVDRLLAEAPDLVLLPGDFVCTRTPDGQWPVECRDERRVAAADVTGLQRLALLIRDRTGLNLSMLYDRWEQGLLWRGLLLSLALIVTSIAGSLILGAAGAWLVIRRVPLLAPAILGLTTFLRMTPPLLLIYVIFFGVGYHLAVRTGVTLNALAVAAVCLSAYAGATNLSAFLEAWEVLARRGGRPQARAVFALAYAPVMGSCVNIAKATGMASAIAVPELVYASASIVAQEGNPDVMMNLLLVVYFLLILGVVATFEQVRRRIARDDRY